MPYTEQEGDLIFDFDHVLNKKDARFETKQLREKTSIQPTDFLLEFANHFSFVEVKDPDRPNPDNPEKFDSDVKEGNLIRKLAGKFRDSYFLFSHQEREPKKVRYVVLACRKKFDDGFWLTKSEELQRSIPWKHKSFKNSPLTVCIILSLEQWKRKFGPESVWRVSEIEDE